MFRRFIKPRTPISQTPSTSASHAMTCTSTDSQTPTCWDVFLSFRGEDTRQNFTGHLHQRLDDHGIRTFKDDLGLSRGEVISDALLDAIRKSKTYIVVLSENYASSSWCLDELAEILNCYETMGRPVVPVFYNIDPSVVRHQTESFEKAFKTHRKRFAGEGEKLNNWRLSLTEIANFSGHHISPNRSEADVINEIVDELLLKINPKTLDVTRYLVGVDSRVKDIITTLLSSDTKGVIKFGIYGMGGVGKTTLAKAVYNQLLRERSFKGSCFLAHVREISKTTEGLVSLQKQLISDLLNSTTKIEVHNLDQGINNIRERIGSAKVLVLIDDIYDLQQYEFLAGPFASGSVVIITTRDEEMLDKVNVDPKYRCMLEGLNDAQSRELFTKYAFGKAEPHNNLLTLSEDILRLAGGLPLALKIFGSHLSIKKEVGWKSFIKTLRQQPNSNVEKRLVISLDALESDDRKIFIDIACFFIGWKKENAVKVMETYYSYTDDKIETLKKRCLLTVNDRDELEMHDLLRDIGRKLAYNDAPNEPGKHSRLWLPEDIMDVLKNHNGTEAIEGIIPGNLYIQDELEGKSFTTETFRWMSKLRFLCFKKVNLIGSFEHIFEDLRLLCWDCCPLKCLPTDFYPKKLVILDLPGSNMRSLWDPNMSQVSPTFRNLKILNMSYSQNLRTTPDFVKFPCLETLNFEGCGNLEAVHISIGSLLRLVSLDLKGCVKLRCLPDTICNLRALEVLTISWCSSLEALPIQLGDIESLTKLDAGTLNVSKLPDSIGNLTKLVKLNLSNNKNLETLPHTVGNLRSLEFLNIDSCSGLKALPSAIGNIETLKKFVMRALNVPKYPDSIGSLTKLVKLDLRENKNLRTLPDTISNLRSLEIIDISACGKLETLPDQLWKMTRLSELDARCATLLKKIPDIGSSQIAFSLRNLKLSDSGITELPSHISQLSNLESLVISCCHRLVSIPKLPPALKRIDANNCKTLKRLSNLCDLKQLEKLNLRGCRRLTEILVLKELIALRELDLTDCIGLKEIQGCEELTSIRILGLGGRGCLLAHKHLTKRLFQVYSEFGHQISVYGQEFLYPWADWIFESPYWTGQPTEFSSTMHAHLLPNESNNYMGMLLCFKKLKNNYSSTFSYSVKNTRTGFTWSDKLSVPSVPDTLTVLVPKSIFSVRDVDFKIEITADDVLILGIHQLFKTEDAVRNHENIIPLQSLQTPLYIARSLIVLFISMLFIQILYMLFM